jgi:hypothetical protein
MIATLDELVGIYFSRNRDSMGHDYFIKKLKAYQSVFVAYKAA